MRRLTIQETKASKFYFRNIYRSRVLLLQYSLWLIILQLLIIAGLYFSKSEPEYFATNSASAIKPLKPMLQPNMSSDALLAPDLPEEISIKQVTVD